MKRRRRDAQPEPRPMARMGSCQNLSAAAPDELQDVVREALIACVTDVKPEDDGRRLRDSALDRAEVFTGQQAPQLGDGDDDAVLYVVRGQQLWCDIEDLDRVIAAQNLRAWAPCVWRLKGQRSRSG